MLSNLTCVLISDNTLSFSHNSCGQETKQTMQNQDILDLQRTHTSGQTGT